MTKMNKCNLLSLIRHWNTLRNRVSEWVKVALRPSNAKMLYMDEKSTEKGGVN